MPSTLPGYEYDIFISYRHNDNRTGGITEFVEHLKAELAATIKEPLSIYFDTNPHDGLLENHDVDKSLEGKLKCLIFIPIISQTYCDPKSFAWQHEFVAFNKLAKADQLGRDIKLGNGNVASRILPIKIHELDAQDTATIATEIGGVLRAIEFIYKEPGVNRPLKITDERSHNQNQTDYGNQINKVANAIKELLHGLVQPSTNEVNPQRKQIEELRSKGVNHSRTRKLKWAVALAAMLMAALGYYYVSSSDATKISTSDIEKSVAVLPFVNMSSDKEQEYFSDGLTEDIITQLAKIKSLKVTSRTSTMQYKENPKSLKEVGIELGVATILEGSVQRAGDQVRITAQLIRADTDEHLWAESYDRPIKDIFSVQREVATAIANVLKSTLSVNEIQLLKRLPTNSTIAYDHFLKGKFLMEKREKEEMANAIIFFEKALKEDSIFVDAISALANAYLLFSSRGWEDPKIAMPLAEKYINKALRLTPESGPAHASLGFFLRLSYNLKGAEEEFRKSIALEPNQNNVYGWLGITRINYGDHEDAINIYKQGLSYNPDLSFVSGTLKTLLLNSLVMTGKDTDALALINKSNPRDWPAAFVMLANQYGDIGNRPMAISFAEKSGDQILISLYRDNDSTLFRNSASKRIEQLEEQLKNGEYISMFDLGNAYFDMGKKAKAFVYLQKAIDARDPHFPPTLGSTDSGREEIRKKIRAVIQY
ncbi:MAG: hypothetical protein RIB47_01760 [Cyclobacteriaceae bacterium]